MGHLIAFVMGVVVTLFAECLALTIYGIRKALKIEKEKRENE